MLLLNLNSVYRKFSAREQKLFVILACLGLIGIFGLIGQSFAAVTETAPGSGGRIIEGTVGQVTSLNPIMPAVSDADLDARALIHAGLLTVNENDQYKPNLAESLPEVSADLKTYTLKLRSDIKWPDGKSITSEDVVFTVGEIEGRSHGSNLRSEFRSVKAEAVDAATVRFTLKEPSVTFLDSLTVGLLPAHISDYDNLNPMGAGAYQIRKIKYGTSGQVSEIQMIANKYYQPQPFINKVTLKVYPDLRTLTHAYNQRHIDNFGLIGGLPVTLNRASKLLKIKLPQYQAVFFNQEANPAILADPAVRQALNKAANRDRIINETYQGSAIAVGGPVLGDITVPPENYSIEEASNLLEQAGWKLQADGVRAKNGQALAFTLYTNTASSNSAVGQVVVEEWRKIGAKVTLQAMSDSDLSSQVIQPRKYDALLLAENVGHDPDPFSFWHSSQAQDPGLNFAMVKNAEIDNIIIQARATADPLKRQDLYSQFINLLNKQTPAVFLVQPLYSYVINKDIQNVNLTEIAMPRERFYQTAEWYIKTKRSFKF